MIVIYTPDSGNKQQWTFEIDELPSRDAEDIEEATGLLFDDWRWRVQAGGAKAQRALLWVLLRRENSRLRFEEISYRVGELSVQYTIEELRDLLAQAEKQSAVTEEQRQQLRDYVAEAEREAGFGGGKGPSSTPESQSGDGD